MVGFGFEGLFPAALRLFLAQCWEVTPALLRVTWHPEPKLALLHAKHELDFSAVSLTLEQRKFEATVLV